MAYTGQVPDTLTPDNDWRMWAACRREDPELFFEPGPIAQAVAKGVCAGCAVRWECLDLSLRLRATDGVWAGLNEKERDELLGRSRRHRAKAVDTC